MPTSRAIRAGDDAPVDIIEADGVFGAGGIRGLAIAGAVAEFAKGNDRLQIKRWRSVAGTSAGAMIAAYLAAGRTPDQLMEMLTRVPRPQYGRGGMLFGGARNLIRRHGLALGDRLQNWFDNEIDGLTFADAKHLRVIAADITSRRILVLPDDLPRYRLPGAASPIDPGKFKVAYAVRMSMSIPYLVNPVQLEDGDGRLCTIVDGGVVSGFPVWLFDVSDPARELERPTIGVRLAAPAAPARRPWWPIAMGLDLLHTGSEAMDQHFVAESARLRTCVIQTFAISGADFEASRAQRDDLIECGRLAAREFLAGFKLEDYSNSAGRGFEPT
jgi:NTE family protein